jgi:DNA-binding GntR family transcriptional regulator
MSASSPDRDPSLTAARASLTDAAYEQIKWWIVNGTVAPNALIDEPETALKLGTSRTPVREALLRLQAEGLVEIARGKGIRVLPLSSADMREAYQVITALETQAVHLLTVQRPTAALLAPLCQATDDLDRALAAGDGEAWGDADERFHRGLLALSGNKRLRQVGFQLRDVAKRAHLVAVRLMPDAYKQVSAQRHRDLIALILRGNPLAAWTEHFEQRVRGEDALVSIVERYKLQNL